MKGDKSSNYYSVSKTEYESLLNQQLTGSYKRANPGQLKTIITKDKRIASQLKLDDRIETPAIKNSYITLKDHKRNYEINKPVRMINPFKSNMGKISKQILDRINQAVRSSTNLNQWKSSTDVIEWFKQIPNKQQQSFISFDIVDFYPSISKELLTQALSYAANFDTITDQEKDIILHTKKSLVFHNGQPWMKANTNEPFDVTMGSFDGAEVCETTGLYILSKLQDVCGATVGLYRDDALCYSNLSPKKVEDMKKRICKIFKDLNLRITIEANQKVTNFLDVTFDLNNASYKPYIKPNNEIKYVHALSNHPPTILKNVPPSINHRLEAISSNEAVFDQCTKPYQEALTRSGHNHKLSFHGREETPQRRRQRSRKVIWFNPPYDGRVTTNVGRKFLQLVNQHFHANHPLHKIFNRYTLKISYSCMPSISKFINAHNHKIMNQAENPNDENLCNCLQPQDCPLEGLCCTPDTVYQATVTDTSNQTQETYVGTAQGSFKTRYNNHKSSFGLSHKRTDTRLSAHIWNLRDENRPYNVTWKILKQTKPYSNATGKCHMCNYEKFIILCKPELASLNVRTEIMAACKHKAKFKLKKYKG